MSADHATLDAKVQAAETKDIAHDADEPETPEAKKEASPAAPPADKVVKREPTKLSASRGLGEWLARHRVSLALTSYQTGQLLLIGSLPKGRISVHERNFVRAMGLIAHPQRLFVSSIAQIWRLENALSPGQLANKHFDRLYVPRNAQTTGDLDVHEMGLSKEGRLIFVNTKYSCLGTFSTQASFKVLWKPPFVSKVAPEDRCHLNGLAMHEGAPKYVTAVSRSDVVEGWRERRGEGGILIDIDTNRIVTEDLSMPHSPRLAQNALWLLDSGRGYLCRVDEHTGQREDVTFCPGFLRGLSFHGSYAAVGTSLPRNGAFKGLALDDQLAARDAEPRCGVYIIDTASGDIVQWLRFEGGAKELFDVSFIPGVRTPMCVGTGSPEMRTLITMEGERPSETAQTRPPANEPAPFRPAA